jgi:hypothetical protein
VLGAYLAAGGNKSVAAREVSLIGVLDPGLAEAPQ